MKLLKTSSLFTFGTGWRRTHNDWPNISKWNQQSATSKGSGLHILIKMQVRRLLLENLLAQFRKRCNVEKLVKFITTDYKMVVG